MHKSLPMKYTLPLQCLSDCCKSYIIIIWDRTIEFFIHLITTFSICLLSKSFYNRYFSSFGSIWQANGHLFMIIWSNKKHWSKFLNNVYYLYLMHTTLSINYLLDPLVCGPICQLIHQHPCDYQILASFFQKHNQGPPPRMLSLHQISSPILHDTMDRWLLRSIQVPPVNKS